MIFNLFFFYFLSVSVYSFDKDFKTVNDRVPLEFNYLFESMKLESKTQLDRIYLVGICKELDENLGFLQKEHIFFLMKSEVMKNILEYKFKKVRSFDMTTFLITRLEEDFKTKEKYLNSFSQWIWRSILAELNYRKKLGFITAKTFNAAQFQDSRKAEALRLKRYLNYIMPWIDRMDALSASQFNDLTKEVSWVILRRINERSLLFKRFASTATTETKITIFNIPSKLLEIKPEELKRLQEGQSALLLNEESEKVKSEANKQVQDMNPDDLSPLSEEVSKELEQKSP